MDKNMIKIDDLLRQRFDDAEEQERPAAWLQMRDLLDKQMPVTRAAVNWRRMFAYVAGVALLAALSVGSYQMSQSFYADGTSVAENNGTGSMQGNAPSSNGVAGAAINSLPDTHAQAKQAAQAAKTSTQPADVATNTAATSATVATSNSNKPGSQANQPTTTEKATNRNNQQAAATHSTPAKSAANSIASNSRTGKNKQNDTEPVADNNKPNNVTATIRNNSAANTSKGADIVPAAATNGNKANAPVLASNTKTTTGNNGNTPNNTKGAAINNNVAANNAKQNEEYKNIPVRKIEREEKVAKGGTPRMDTIFNGDDVKKVKMHNEDQLAAKTTNNEDEELASGSNINPAASTTPGKKEVDAEGSPTKKLGDRKENPGKQKGNKPPRFEEVVRNANLKMGAVKFYPGILGGVNVALNGNYGIHGGLAGNLTVGDRWAILTEVKYAFRFNNVKETINDDYVNNVQSTTINGQHAYTYDSMQHYYTFNNYSSLEVPLMLTYTQNRFVYMLGANFRYNFTIAPTEEEQKYMLAQTYTTTSQPKFATEKKVLLSDFGSSFNIAPMLGFGYKINPSMTLDARISKSVWNNANSTTGQTEIYKRLYNMPQLQMNLTIRPSFGGKKGYKRAQ